MLKVPNQAEVILLKTALNIQAAEELDLKLYKNNHTPAETDTEADYTEADFIGYAAEPLDHTVWVVSAGDPANAAYGDVVFTSTASGQSQIVYGYFVVGRSTGKLMWAEIFSDNDPDAPYTIVNLGDTITVPLAFTGRDESD